MNRIHESIKPITVLAPKSQTAAGNDTTEFVDGAIGMSIDFVISFGALAAKKKITAELLMSDAAAGSSPTSLGKQDLTAPTGGLTKGTFVVSTEVRGDYKRYYGVKVTNDAADAVLVAVTALVAGKHSDENNDFDVLTVY